MSFFDMYPMGGINVGGGKMGRKVGGLSRGVYRGGEPVGGINVGGMYPMMSMGGIPVGGINVGGAFQIHPPKGAEGSEERAVYDAFRGKIKASRASSKQAKDAFVLTRTAELILSGMSKKLAKRQADYEYQAVADKSKAVKAKMARDAKPKKPKAERVARASRKKVYTEEEVEEMKQERGKFREARKEATKSRDYSTLFNERPLFNQFEQVRRRIGATARGRAGTQYAGEKIPVSVLSQIEDLLTQNGFGVMDLHSGEMMGEGFWDDVYDGLKQVGSTALKILPSLL